MLYRPKRSICQSPREGAPHDGGDLIDKGNPTFWGLGLLLRGDDAQYQFAIANNLIVIPVVLY